MRLRDAWSHEAHSFTPWLAANIDRLGEALGIPLELEGQEVQVGGFSADLLARNPQDNSLWRPSAWCGSVRFLRGGAEGRSHRQLTDRSAVRGDGQAQRLAAVPPDPA
ncbi:MAG: hypothetical protein AB1Z22_07600 [Synechococcaceae cyanobacterium]